MLLRSKLEAIWMGLEVPGHEKGSAADGQSNR